MFGLIYKATAPNGKVYIGKTTRTLEKRKHQHQKDALFYDMKMSRAVRKYGVDRFRWEIIIENIPREYLNELEIFLIWFHNSYNSGLNSTHGGDGGSPMLGKHHSEETKKQIKQSNILFYEENIEKFSGANNAFFGKKHKPETKEKMRQRKLGRRLSEQHKSKLGLKDNKHPMYRHDITNDMILSECIKSGGSVKITLKLLNISRTLLYERLHKIGYKSFQDLYRSLTNTEPVKIIDNNIKKNLSVAIFNYWNVIREISKKENISIKEARAVYGKKNNSL